MCFGNQVGRSWQWWMWMDREMEEKGCPSLRRLAWTHFPAQWCHFLSWGGAGLVRSDLDMLHLRGLSKEVDSCQILELLWEVNLEVLKPWQAETCREESEKSRGPTTLIFWVLTFKNKVEEEGKTVKQVEKQCQRSRTWSLRSQGLIVPRRREGIWGEMMLEPQLLPYQRINFK